MVRASWFRSKSIILSKFWEVDQIFSSTYVVKHCFTCLMNAVSGMHVSAVTHTPKQNICCYFLPSFFFFANTLVFSGHHIRPWYDHAKQQKRFLYIINSFDYLLFLQHLMDSFSYIHISNISAECGCVNSTVLKANSEINFVPNWKILQ